MNTYRKNRAILFSIVLSVWVVVLATPVLAGGSSEAADSDRGRDTTSVSAETVARIEYLEGEVQIDSDAATVGQIVDAGARIQTGADGIAEIVFGSGNALRVEENTFLTLDLTDPANGIDLRRGVVAAVFEGLETIGVGPERTLHVNTPTTIAGVRGTVFFIRVESEESTYVCTCHGELSFDDGDLTVRAARHSARRFIRTSDGIAVETAAEEYHDSDSLNAVADVVGVTIAWGEEPD